MAFVRSFLYVACCVWRSCPSSALVNNVRVFSPELSHGRSLLSVNVTVTVGEAYFLISKWTEEIQKESGNRKVVYTVITGRYDVPSRMTTVLAGDDVDRILVTDDSQLTADGWHVLAIKVTGDPQQMSRDLKMRPHLHFPTYEKSLYIDANVRVISPLTDYFRKVIRGGPQLVVYSFSRTLMGEAYWVEDYTQRKHWNIARQDAHEQVQKQVMRYLTKFPQLADPYPGVFYGKVILRLHDERTKRFGDLWFNEFQAGIHRDQLSFQYCALAVGLRVEIVKRTCHQCPPKTDPGFNRWFQVHAHDGPGAGQDAIALQDQTAVAVRIPEEDQVLVPESMKNLPPDYDE